MVRVRAAIVATAAAWLTALSGAAGAQAPHGHAGGADPAGGAASASEAGAELVAGEVRRIDRDRHRITLRHGEIRNLGMPPMTMVFRVRDPAWLDQVQVGDKVSFRLETINGVLTITELRPAQ